MTTIPKLRALDCPQCGGPVTVRTFGHALNVTCPQCGSVLDATDPRVRVLQQSANRSREVTPKIPLGTRGAWRGHLWEVVGFQQRAITVEGTRYAWDEYLLFNPYRGFRYLTEYQGHWNDVVPLPGLPEKETAGGRPTATLAGESFRHFQSAEAVTTFVLGEFPWQVRVGDAVQANDYVAPPRILSSERTADEETWSVGAYVDGRDIWKAFKLPGRPPSPRGVYANQPSPTAGRVNRLWGTFVLLALLVLGECTVRQGLARRESVFSGHYTFRAQPGDDSAFVTDVFELKGRQSNVQVATQSELSNDWLFVNYALIDEASGRAWEFGREVSYYSGRDADGAWTEGSRRDAVTVPAVPAGRYYLRVKPEGEPGRQLPLTYEIRVRRDVPSLLLPALALLLLAVPPTFALVRHLSFEHQRWMESDYTPVAQQVIDAVSED
ncbi:MAG: DUF4178 domain-containing protein [Gemmatimonadaceae bacterium]